MGTLDMVEPNRPVGATGLRSFIDSLSAANDIGHEFTGSSVALDPDRECDFFAELFADLPFFLAFRRLRGSNSPPTG